MSNDNTHWILSSTTHAGIIKRSRNWRPQQQGSLAKAQLFVQNINVATPLLTMPNKFFCHADARSYCQRKLTDCRYSDGIESSNLTHTDGKGRAKMVDVSEKKVTAREAVATARVEVNGLIAKLIADNNMKKGDVLSIAQIAGILGAKKTSELIPLCHNIALNVVKVEAKLNEQRNYVELCAIVRCSGRTGVEMEALTAVSVAALTVYDMCKAVSHDIVISNIRLQSKSGGKRDFSSVSNPEEDVSS